MAPDPAKRAARLKQIVDFLDFNQCQGLTVDFEEVPDNAQADIKTFLKEMSAAFKPRGWKILLSVPFNDIPGIMSPIRRSSIT